MFCWSRREIYSIIACYVHCYRSTSIDSNHQQDVGGGVIWCGNVTWHSSWKRLYAVSEGTSSPRRAFQGLAWSSTPTLQPLLDVRGLEVVDTAVFIWAMKALPECSSERPQRYSWDRGRSGFEFIILSPIRKMKQSTLKLFSSRSSLAQRSVH